MTKPSAAEKALMGVDEALDGLSVSVGDCSCEAVGGWEIELVRRRAHRAVRLARLEERFNTLTQLIEKNGCERRLNLVTVHEAARAALDAADDNVDI